MNDLDQQNVDFEDDEQIQITDLDPEGSPQRRRAERILTLFRKSATLPWARYSLTSLFLFIFFSATFLHFYQPTPATSTLPPTPTALPKRYDVNLNFAQNRFYAQANDGTVTAYESEAGRAIWHNKLPEPAFIRAFGQILYCYYGTPQHQGRLEARSANDGRLL